MIPVLSGVINSQPVYVHMALQVSHVTCVLYVLDLYQSFVESILHYPQLVETHHHDHCATTTHTDDISHGLCFSHKKNLYKRLVNKLHTRNMADNGDDDLAVAATINKTDL